MTNKRVIIVSGCYECPKVESRPGQVLKQGAGIYWNYTCGLESFNVNEYMKNKTLPGNCPLDKLSSIQKNS